MQKRNTINDVPSQKIKKNCFIPNYNKWFGSIFCGTKQKDYQKEVKAWTLKTSTKEKSNCFAPKRKTYISLQGTKEFQLGIIL